MKCLDNKMREHLNIALLGHKRIPSREGGIEIVVEQLSTRMVQKGHKVTVYNRAGHHVAGKEFDNTESMRVQEYRGVRIITVPTIERRGLAALTSSFFATTRALFGHYNCMHFHAEGPSVMLLIPHIFGIRTVVTIHGLDWARSKWGGFATKYLMFGEKIAAKYADEIIVLSKNIQRYFKDTYKRDTIFIPNGIDKPINKPIHIVKEKWSLEKNSYILFVGRIVPEKGIQYLIDAYKQLNTHKKLVIAGGTSDSDNFYKQIKDRAVDDERIIFTGFVQGKTLEELYSNAFIYVLPSDLEGMPISLLEAMSYGNCCLVSDIPECAEIIEDKGVIFKAGDVNDLRQKLEGLCQCPDTVYRYQNDVRDFVCLKYNWDEIVDQTLSLYRS
jgi:glycosyltransferase involved in cell wall biosynthesis